MKILMFCYEYPPLGGGGGVGVRDFAHEWRADGYDVTVVTSRSGDLPRRSEEDGVDVVRVGTVGRKARATATTISMLSYLVAGLLFVLFRWHPLHAYHVINTHFALPTGPLGWAAAKLLGIPQVLTIIGGDIYDPSKKSSPHRHGWLRWLNRFLMRRAGAVVAISSDTRNRAIRLYDVQRSIRVIPHGISPPDRSSIPDLGHRLPADRFNLVAVGRLVPRKGLDYLIRAVALLPEDVALHVIGDGPEAARLRGLVATEGIPQRVEWLGYVTRSELFGYLASADCFVLPSLHEGLGLVVQEAMWSGLPVVATNEGGQRDLVIPGRNGFLVPPADVTALAQAIMRLKWDRSLRRRMSQRNRQDVRRFLVRRVAKDYTRLFGRLSSDSVDPHDPGDESRWPGREVA